MKSKKLFGRVFLKIAFAALLVAVSHAQALLAYEPQALVRLLDRVTEVKQQGKTPYVLFDIDDTLLDSRPRTLKIFADFMSQDDVRRSWPDDINLLGALQIQQIGFNTKSNVRAAGVKNEEFVEKVFQFWQPRFFSGDYLLEDTVTTGALEFVNEILARGGAVIYFTGRDERMRQGTLEAFKRREFPLPNGENVLLFMKPTKEQPDAEYKNSKLSELAALDKVVGGLENEPQNMNLFRKYIPDGNMIFIDTIRSGKTDPATGQEILPASDIPWIKDFRLP